MIRSMYNNSSSGLTNLTSASISKEAKPQTASVASSPASDKVTISSAGAAAASAKTTTNSSASGSSSNSGKSNGGGGGALNASDLSQLMSTSFSVTVDGKQYSGSISSSNGEYTATVAGASATGSSESSAENAVETRLSELA